MAPSQTNYAEIQHNEIEALRSIFMEDFEEEETKAGAWNKTSDRAFRIKLKVSTDEYDEVSTILSVSFPATYPKTLPRCVLAYDVAVPGKTRVAIDKLIKTKPKMLLGSEMIFELASTIQEILEDAASKQVDSQDAPALDQERALQEAAAQRKVQAAKEAKVRQLKDANAEEERLLSTMVEQEKARVAKTQVKSRNDYEPISEAVGELNFDQQIKARDAYGTIFAFRTVKDKVKYRQGQICSISTVSVAETEKGLAPFLALKECVLSPKGSGEDLKKAVQSLEAQLETLIQLPAHASVMNPLGFRIQRYLTALSASDTTWTVSILSNLATQGSLKDALELAGTIDVKKVRSWAIQIIEGLEFYHTHRIVHGDIHAGNILFERSEHGVMMVKLSDCLYQNELHLLSRRTSGDFSTAPSAYWLPPERGDPSNAKDIWDLGVLLLQMMFGLEVQRFHESPITLMDSLSLSPSLEDFISTIFTQNPSMRPSAFQLLPSHFLRSDDPLIQVTLPSALSRSSFSASTLPARPTKARSDSTQVAPSWSRFLTDFVEAGRLGKGGFGEVVRARNKLDGRLYAIKKITASSAAALTGVLSEIILLSRLNHPYIVRYYTAWTEQESFSGAANDSSASEMSDSSSLPQHKTSKVDFGSTTPGLDFISTSGYPDIVFGSDSGDHHSEATDDEAIISDDAEQETDEEVQHVSHFAIDSQRRRSSAAQIPSKTTLYIQMEYCERQTLRDLIRGDIQSNIEDCWRLFRQILEGLVHVHTNGVIHRDLKPENVFIDNLNNVRIGDFGLARPGDHHTSTKVTSPGMIDPALTQSIGTSLYVAPEVRSAGGGNYNHKADMYSLGIILFEMSYPLKTAMERVNVISELRGKKCTIPAEFEKPEMSAQGEVILSLVRHKASERPSSLELIRSGKVPTQVEDEQIKIALESISDKNSPYHAKVMSALFSRSQGNEKLKDFAYDMALGADLTSEDLLLRSLVRHKLTEIFRCHGAVEETRRPILFPTSAHYSNNAVRLLTGSGDLVQLPFDLILPHARTLAKQHPSARKTFAFADVYREAAIGTHPARHGEVDFDIVSLDNLDLALREAEVLKVIDEVIDGFPSLGSVQMCFLINHSRLLSAILTFCGIAEEKRAEVKETLSKLNFAQFSWAKMRNELRSPSLGVASTSIDDLMRFDFKDPYEIAIPRLRSILQNTEGLESTFSHLQAVTTYLDRFKVKRKVFISPLSCFNEKFYRGHILFQCIYDGKKREVFAAGGRYDRLILDHRTTLKLDDRHAVGCMIGWEKLFTSMARHRRGSSKASLKKGEEELRNSWTTRRCDVLVDSVDTGILRSTGIKLVQDLWTNNISAELVIDLSTSDNASHPKTKEGTEEHDWIVLIKQDGLLKVRSVTRKEDVELRKSELTSWLRAEIRDRDRADGKSVERARLIRQPSQQEPGAISEDKESNVKVLSSLSRSKKTNRMQIIEDAQLRTQELVQSFLEGPVAAIETKDDIFEGIRDTRLSDPESWRKLIQSVPAGDRTYLSDLHNLLDEMATQTKGNIQNAFIYNFRTRACMYYDLGRVS